MPADAAASSPSVTDLQRRNDMLEAELRARAADCDEAQARESALAEVLNIISRSGGDPRPVFEVILARAMTLCDAAFGVFNSFDGQSFKTVAARGVPEAYLQFRLSNPPDYGPETGPGRLVAGENSFHVVDMSDTDAYRAGDPNRRAIVDLGGARTNLVVALRKDNHLLGMMAIYRKEVRPFSHKQIALVQTFADQAVIAMENARLFGELRQRTDELTESLKYQTATSDVLKVISRSTFVLQKVLDTLVESAVVLCEADIGTIRRREGEAYKLAATFGFSPEARSRIEGYSPLADRSSIFGQAVLEERTVHIPDVLADPDYFRPDIQRLTGFRAALGVLLRREGNLIGTLVLQRFAPGPFTPRQIELVETFADQAVIAMENARLLAEQREALEQQTATSEVLQVINSSPGDLAPVFDAMLEKAMRLCGAVFGDLRTYDGERFYPVAARGVPDAYIEYYRGHGASYGPGTGPARILSGERVVHIPDLIDTEAYRRGDPDRRALVDLGGARASLLVPLLKDPKVAGFIMIYRQEAGTFSDKQIKLLQNFAAQAVIAMENAHLLGELRQRTDDLTESLEYQTATSELLEVISRSTSDIQPVLDTMLAAAGRLCDTTSGGIAIRQGDVFQYVANMGKSAEFKDLLRAQPYTIDRSTVIGRVVLSMAPVQIADAQADPDYHSVPTDAGGIRTILGVPLLREQEVIGVIILVRDRVEPFTERQIALVKTFADQAVIAMENARLLGELRQRTDDLTESLEYQTATSEVLELISRSTSDVQPVLDSMVATATRLCGGTAGTMAVRQGESFRHVSTVGLGAIFDQALRERPLVPRQGTISERVLLERQIIHVADLEADPDYPLRDAAHTDRLRTALGVPLMREGETLGVFVVARDRVELFTDRQIGLVKTFADQAVIAMENARLLSELRESLDQQTATSDVLKTISRSSVGLESVLQTLVETVGRLCRSDQAYLFRRQDELLHMIASFGVPEEARQWIADRPFESNDTSITGRVARLQQMVHIPDVLADPGYAYPGRQIAGFRTLLGIPLLRENALLGVFVVARTTVAPFSDKEVELASGFADQAVIAIENARLFEELRDRQAELRVTFDNMGDGVVMFDADLKLAAWNRNFQELLDVPDDFLVSRPGLGDYVRLLVQRGELGDRDPDKEVARYTERATRQWSTERTRPDGRVLEVRNNPVPGGGAVLIYSDITRRKQAEAEIRAARDAAESALERQTATADILKVIASSPTDVQPVLDVVAKAAVQFCGATDAVIHLRDGDEALSAAHEGTVKSVMGVRRPLDRQTTFGRAMLDGLTIQFPDVEVLDPAEYALTRRLAKELGFRAVIGAPLLREGAAIGALTLRRVEPGPFTPQQIELLETFAAQAVIAIENVRLFTELREALEQQTATAEILRVISQSPTDVTPVLAAVAKAALKFCGARDAQVGLRDGDHWFIAANEGPIGVVPGPRPLNRQTTPGRAILDGKVVQIADFQSAEADGFPESRNYAARLGVRSALAAPLMRDDMAIGAITLRRPEAGEFTPNQIELLQSFAAQAVIAIENVRLFTELRDSLERLKAAQANLIQAEKMASLGQLTAGIAHEIKNPLNFVNNFAGLSSELLDELKQGMEALVAAPDDDKRAELQDTMELLNSNLGKILEHGRRADGIVKSMLAHSRGGTGDWQTGNINNLVEEALNLAFHGARAQDKDFNVTLERDFESMVKPIDLVPQDVTRVFLNLFGNGFYATRKRQSNGGDSDYRPTLRVSTRDLGESIEVRVHDNGIGISSEVREKLFQPFFTTKPTGEGTGLGLSISYDIVTQQHGGWIEVESEVGQFSEFIVRLPRARRVAAT